MQTRLHLGATLPMLAGTLVLAGAGGALAQQTWPEREGLGFNFYGQINSSILSYDDGVESKLLGPVDNVNNLNGSSIGFVYDGEMDSGWIYSARGQLQIGFNQSDEVSLQDTNPGIDLETDDISFLEVGFHNPDIGTFYIGQGDMTANLSSPDYSGTDVVAGPNVSQIAGGMVLRFPDGSLSDQTLGESFGTYDSGQLFRLRYDSRDYNGFAFSGSVGQDIESSRDEDDVTHVELQASYEKRVPNWTYSVVADVIYLSEGTYRGEVLPESIYQGKFGFGFIHSSGVNFSLTLAADTGEVGHYHYYKAGYARDFFDIGTTNISFEYYNNGDWAVDGAEGKSYGISVVQDVDNANMQVYGAWRDYDAYQHADIPNQDFLKGNALMAGLKWEF